MQKQITFENCELYNRGCSVVLTLIADDTAECAVIDTENSHIDIQTVSNNSAMAHYFEITTNIIAGDYEPYIQEYDDTFITLYANMQGKYKVESVNRYGHIDIFYTDYNKALLHLETGKPQA